MFNFSIFLLTLCVTINFLHFKFKNLNHLITITSLIITFLIFFLKKPQIDFFMHKIFSNLNYNFYGIVLFILSIFISIISYLVMDTKTQKQIYVNSAFLTINMFIFFLVNTNNYLVFFFMYEMLLLVSVFLVYLSSPNIRSKNVAFYFLLWTQLGSFIVLLAISILVSKSTNYEFSTINFLTMSVNEKKFIKFLIFTGFSIKIPMWPFHFWLTKTHVEANTGFSIYLSGILVKTALFGIYKFFILFENDNNFVFILFIFLSILDSTIKIFAQTDLKKIVAYCTVFEMNLIFFVLMFLNKTNFIFIIIFSILHATLSGLFFFVVDCIYKRYNSRNTQSVLNISNYYPLLTLNILLSIFIFNGLPLTIKFYMELIILYKLLTYNTLYFIIFVLIQIYFIIFFTKHFMNILFSFKNNKITSDLTLKEIFIFVIFYFIIAAMSLI